MLEPRLSSRSLWNIHRSGGGLTCGHLVDGDCVQSFEVSADGAATVAYFPATDGKVQFYITSFGDLESQVSPTRRRDPTLRVTPR